MIELVVADRCTACQQCVAVCPSNVFEAVPDGPPRIARIEPALHKISAAEDKERFAQHPQILGLELAESRALLEQIIAQYHKPENQVRFSWQPGSLAFWDNRAAVHYAVRNYGDFPRSLDRILVADEPLYSTL